MCVSHCMKEHFHAKGLAQICRFFCRDSLHIHGNMCVFPVVLDISQLVSLSPQCSGESAILLELNAHIGAH